MGANTDFEGNEAEVNASVTLQTAAARLSKLLEELSGEHISTALLISPITTTHGLITIFIVIP